MNGLKTVSTSTRIALFVLMAATFSFAVQKAHAGPEVAPLVENGCEACHRLADSAPVEGRKGPDLFYVGDKFQRAWLKSWLQAPRVIRPSGFTSDPGFLEGHPTVAVPHPSLDAETAGAVTDALMQMKLEDLQPGPPELTEPLSKGQRFRIKILFERDFGCISCHQSVNLAGQPRGGISGPTLLDAGNRLQADWIYHWLKSPRRFEPKGRMPLFELTDEERSQLVRYVLWHKVEIKK